MYPLVEIGPLRLASGGLMLLLAGLVTHWLFVRAARARGGPALATQADHGFYAALLGAVVGGRLWFGVFNRELYQQTPSLWFALRLTDLAWPGALFGGALAGWLWCRWKGAPALALADSATLALPAGQAIASLGLLLSGEAFGAPTTLAWGIPLFGTLRHPTQVLFALAALISFGVLHGMARRAQRAGALLMAYLALQGLTMLLVEALRGDSLLLPGGIRAAQVVGLALLLVAIAGFRRIAMHAPADANPA
jgi:phosphatidylglycerol:prolipoprotein diacylglycerol transferase